MDRRLEVIGVACQNCVGACCRAGAALQMTEHEAYMNKREMALERVVKARKYTQTVIFDAEGFDESGRRIPVKTPMVIGLDYGLYLLTEDCGHLTEDNRCGIYDSPNRPRVCGEYEVGAAACLAARQAFGVETPSPEI